MKRYLPAAALLSISGSTAFAVPAVPLSYDMLNGAVGSYEYFDETYNGSGSPNLSYSPLSGGTGDLTDGVIATDNWFVTEAPAGPGPYVGWLDFNPTITFHFGSPQPLLNATLYLDDSNGNGGVTPPLSVDVSLDGGAALNYLVPDPASGAPFSFTVPLGVASDVAITLNRQTEWVFLSEVTFEARSTVPGVPDSGASLALLLGGVSALALFRPRKP